MEINFLVKMQLILYFQKIRQSQYVFRCQNLQDVELVKLDKFAENDVR